MYPDGLEGLAGREWAELEACSCEKNGGRVKCEVLGGVDMWNFDSMSLKEKSECIIGW